MYETPQGLYGTVWHPLGHGEFNDFILTETGEPLFIESVHSETVANASTVLIIDQSGPNIWMII
jgi:hypothetical protein